MCSYHSIKHNIIIYKQQRRKRRVISMSSIQTLPFHNDARGSVEPRIEALADFLGDNHNTPVVKQTTSSRISDMQEEVTAGDIIVGALSASDIPSKVQTDPFTGMVHCSVVRDEQKVVMSFQSYNGQELTCLVADKQNKLQCKYHIYDVSSGGYAYRILKKNDPQYVGKFRRNKDLSVNSFSLYNVNRHVVQVAEYLFEVPTFKTIFAGGSNPPRMMQAAIYSEPTDVIQSCNNTFSKLVTDHIQAHDDLDGFGAVHLGLHLLRTKEPFNRETGRFALDFHGRGNMASVKNMQLVGQDGKVVAQFVKIDKDRFHLDYNTPLNAFQAFGFALAQLEKKK